MYPHPPRTHISLKFVKMLKIVFILKESFLIYFLFSPKFEINHEKFRILHPVQLSYLSIREFFFIRFKKILSFCASSISFVEKSIFVAEKRLLYEKASIFNGEYDGTKIKLIA